MEGRKSAICRWLGISLIGLSYFLPLHGCVRSPKQFAPEPPDGLGFVPDPGNPVMRAAEDVPEAMARGWERGGPALAVWEARTFYAYLLVPFWVVALLALRGASAAGRRRWGLATLSLTVVLALFELIYLAADFNRGFLAWRSGIPRSLQVLAVWGVVLAVLVLRVKGRRTLDDAEATVSSQALLAGLHALSFPAWDALRWGLQGHGPWPIAATLSYNYRPGIWIAAVGFLLVARPGYFSGAPSRSGYDPALPWGSRSSTPTPTSTSRSSTGTASRSSSAPAPPASSPS